MIDPTALDYVEYTDKCSIDLDWFINPIYGDTYLTQSVEYFDFSGKLIGSYDKNSTYSTQVRSAKTVERSSHKIAAIHIKTYYLDVFGYVTDTKDKTVYFDGYFRGSLRCFTYGSLKYGTADLRLTRSGLILMSEQEKFMKGETFRSSIALGMLDRRVGTITALTGSKQAANELYRNDPASFEQVLFKATRLSNEEYETLQLKNLLDRAVHNASINKIPLCHKSRDILGVLNLSLRLKHYLYYYVATLRNKPILVLFDDSDNIQVSALDRDTHQKMKSHCCKDDRAVDIQYGSFLNLKDYFIQQ
jgi:hypothetical protein